MPLDTTNSTDTIAQAPQAATSAAGASLGSLIQVGFHGGYHLPIQSYKYCCM